MGLTCTEMELAFMAWQSANDRVGQLERNGLAWEAFSAWWNTREWSMFSGSHRQLTFAAWNASHDVMELAKMTTYDEQRYTRWYQSVFDQNPVIVKEPT